tara:strand:- start:384 stop:677 length:294 start_codon:yes stop_codon:yes gene_type:complete
MPDPWENIGWGEGKTRPDQKAKSETKNGTTPETPKEKQLRIKSSHGIGIDIGDVSFDKPVSSITKGAQTLYKSGKGITEFLFTPLMGYSSSKKTTKN